MVVKLRPRWDYCNDKPGRDSDGDKLSTDRGYRGDSPITREERLFQKTYDAKADDFAYGRRGDRPNGQQVVQTKKRDPGTITNDGDKGYRGVDE
jgi:hypothetical protein